MKNILLTESALDGSHVLDAGKTADGKKNKKGKQVVDNGPTEGMKGMEFMEHLNGQTNAMVGEGVSERPLSPKEVIDCSSDSDGQVLTKMYS